MATIKKVYADAAKTTQLYPQTHEKAVVDDNGVTLESKLGAVTDLVNQKQMEMGAVPIDITPTEGHTTHVVSSDGVAVAIAGVQADVGELQNEVFGESTLEDIPYNYIYSANTAVQFDWIGIIKDGDLIEISCQTGYQAYAFITNAQATSVEQNITNGEVSSYSGIYNYGDNRRTRIEITKVGGGSISEADALANVDFHVRRYVRNSGLANKKPTINALFIGNSVSQDHVSYLPWLLKNTYGDDVKFRICQSYKAGYTIAKYVTDICTDNVRIDIFSVADNVQDWTNTSNYLWSSIWSNYGHFDIICFEGYYNNDSLIEDPASFALLIDDLKSRQTEPFKLCYLMHQTYTYGSRTETAAWQRIVDGAKYAIVHNPVSLLFPCGVVTKLVNGQIPEATLTNDKTHNQQGFPCIMGAYTIMDVLSRYVGLPSKILNNPLRINAATEALLHIPGPNGSLQVGTEAQYGIIQDAAVQAMKWSDNLMITNSGDIL